MGFGKAISLIVILCMLLGSRQSRTPAQNQGKPPATSDSVLFVVTAGTNAQGEAVTRIDPIVVIKRGRFEKPPAGVEENAGGFNDSPQSARFAATYFRRGQTFQMLFGGGKVGTATVVRRSARSCSSLAATVQLQSAIKPGGWVMALATDSEALGLPASSRQAVSPDERAEILTIVKRIYRRHPAAAALLNKITVTNLTAVDLNRDGSMEFVGSFRIEQNLARDSKAHLLFLIIEKRAGNYRIDLQHYREGAETGEDFVDHLDLDGDGRSEVITQVDGYETWEYAIYKKRAGDWQKAYSGGGGGC